MDPYDAERALVQSFIAATGTGPGPYPPHVVWSTVIMHEVAKMRAELGLPPTASTSDAHQ